MQYKITKQYGRGPETLFAEFKELNDAQFFIEKIKLPEDATLNVKVFYRVSDGIDIVKEYDPNKIETQASAASQTAAGGGEKGSKSTFSPTPFNTAPKPAGSPQKWTVDKPEEDKKK
jgi:hypothetical protein